MLKRRFIKRSDSSILSKWYFQIDRTIIFLVLLLIGVGILTLFSAGPYAARRIGYPSMFFLHKYCVPAFVGICAMFFCSFLSKKNIQRISVLGLIIGLILLMITMVHPMVIKGSKRWIHLGIQLQPSEVLKPFWIVFTAYFLSKLSEKVPGRFFVDFKKVWKEWAIVGGLLLFIVSILFLQPDFGMTLIYLSVFGIMLFLAGTSLKSVFVFLGGFVASGGLAYLLLSHVRGRINTFLGLENGADPYQIKQAVDCIRHGGIFGQWGNGFVKTYLPDSHTDFVFATIVEDFGALIAILILFIYISIIYKVLKKMMIIKDKFTLIAVGGIISVFTGQVFVNIATNLKIMPPKGMTLPFISYGGSSFVAFCVLFGFLLALLRSDRKNFLDKGEINETK